MHDSDSEGAKEEIMKEEQRMEALVKLNKRFSHKVQGKRTGFIPGVNEKDYKKTKLGLML